MLGQIGLLSAFVASGYAASVYLLNCRRRDDEDQRMGTIPAVALAVSVVSLTVVLLVLAAALLMRDFSFEYVANYSSRQLPWHYSLSALWVGQAGSLLLWAWLTLMATVTFRLTTGRSAGALLDGPMRDGATGLLMAYVAFLLAIMVFAADPTKASPLTVRDGTGLSPLLQHPAMMIHPPVVFTGYALWSVPFALAMAALLVGRLDVRWVELARPWALMAWTILGVGILMGAYWAYEELGWGGYWGWDPVENGSLIPWLTGTALLHGMMVWRRRGGMKKSTMALALATFGFCNLATFLTRSGIFSSLHAFSQSPIGWMFLVVMIALTIGGGWLIFDRRRELVARHQLSSIWSRESLVLISSILLAILTTVVVFGTLAMPLSTYLSGSTAVVGPEFYNAVLVPIGLMLLSATAVAPLMRWGKPPTEWQWKLLRLTVVAGLAGAGVAAALGVRHWIALLVAGVVVLAVGAILSALWYEASRLAGSGRWPNPVVALVRNRRQYAGYAIHLGIMSLAVGVTGSSLGTRRHDVVLQEGDTISWAGREITYVKLIQRTTSDKLIAEAALDVTEGDRPAVRLFPARHFHQLQEHWTTEVAIDSTWRGDFYTILNYGEGGGAVSLTFVDNPLMRWIWVGGLIVVAAMPVGLWPSRRRRTSMSASSPRMDNHSRHLRQSEPRRRWRPAA